MKVTISGIIVRKSILEGDLMRSKKKLIIKSRLLLTCRKNTSYMSPFLIFILELLLINI